MKNKLSLGIVLHNIPLVNLRNSQELRTGLALKPFQYGPLIHFAYHLNRKNDSFHLGGQINFINKVDLIAGFQDFDLNKSAVGLSAQIFDFIFDVSYRLQTEAVNISMQINFSEPKKDMAQKYRGSGAKKVKNNDYFGGLKEYYKALAYDPEDENINLIVSALREKVDSRRMKIDSLFTLGQSFEEKGWYVNAFNTYRGILNVDPSNRKTRKQMKSINSKVNKHIGELYVQGADYYKRNEMSQAEIVFRKILSVNKSHEGANFYIEKIVNGDMLGGFIEPSRNKLYGYPKSIESFSALTNARALGLLARYYFLVYNDGILSKIDHILNIFEYPSDEGGVLKKNNDNFWYLEYSYGNNSPVVFNGFLSALIGLYDIYEVFKDQNNEELSSLTKKSKKLFDCGFETLLKNINKIEYHNNLLNFRWLKYDDNKLFFADSHYFILKLNQIKTLYEYVKNPVLEKTHKRWIKIYKENRTKATVFEFLYQLYKLLTFIEDKVRNDEK